MKIMDKYAPIFHIGKRYKIQIVMSLFCALLTNVSLSIMPIYLARLIDAVTSGKTVHEIINIFLFYLLIFGIYMIIDIAYTINWQTLHNHFINKDAKGAILKSILKLNFRDFTKKQSGEWFTLMTSDADEVLYIAQYNAFQFISNALLLIVSYTFLFYLNAAIGALTFFITLLPTLFTRPVAKKIGALSEKTREEKGTMNDYAIELISHKESVVMARKKEYLLTKFFRSVKRTMYLAVEKSKWETVSSFCIDFFQTFIRLAIYGIAAYLVVNGTYTLGFFIAYLSYLNKIQSAWQFIIENYISLRYRMVSVNKVTEALNSPGYRTRPDDPGKPAAFLNGNIEFSKVNYSYDKRIVFKDMNFAIDANKITAIIGLSGSGKTTISRLLLKHLVDYTGTITIDGIDLKCIDERIIRQAISIVPQEVFLFNDTLLFNMTLNNPVDREEVHNLCEKLGLDDLIKTLPAGLDTVIDENNQLSSGQKQKVLLIRVLLRKGNIIILDEGTSAMDMQSENKVIELINQYKSGKTFVFITHSMNPINTADKIINLSANNVDNQQGKDDDKNN
jgi:ABC-type multidrug transport system fused ATPase/permease subunit